MMAKLLVVGLDYSGKTTLVKCYKGALNENEADYFTTTPYINVEKVKLPKTNQECIVLDMSGQVRKPQK